MRPLGSTRLAVTPIGLGLAALGRPAYINAGREEDLGADRSVTAMERRCHEVLDAAYAAGVRYVDAARSYGLAEAFLRSWFEKSAVPQGAITVGSKWGYRYTGEWRLDADVQEVKDLSVDNLTRQIAESRAELGGHLGLYQIHSATVESGVLEDRRVLETLRRLQSDGLVIGLTTSGPRQADVIRRALELSAGEGAPFRVVQATWNLLEPSCGGALADAHAAGWGVIVKEVLANGRLTARSAEPAIRVLSEVAEPLGAEVEQVAIAAAAGNPWADVVLSGAATVPQVRSSVRAIRVTLSDTNRQRLAALAQPADAYWSERTARRWT